MIVYVVMGFVDGLAVDTVKVFMNRDDAIAYGKELDGEKLESFNYYDYHEIVETEVR